MEEEEGRGRGLKAVAVKRLGNLKFGFHWLNVGWFCDLIGPLGTSQSILFADVEYQESRILEMCGGDSFLYKFQ